MELVKSIFPFCRLLFCTNDGVLCCAKASQKVATICPCLKSLSEAKVKCFRLIPLVEEISKQPRIDSVMWLLVVILMKTYNKKERNEHFKMYNARRRAPGSEAELSLVFKKIKAIENWNCGVQNSLATVAMTLNKNQLKSRPEFQLTGKQHWDLEKAIS